MASTLQPPTKRSSHTALGTDPDDTEDEPVGTLAPLTDATATLDFDQDEFDVTLDDLDDLDVSLPTDAAMSVTLPAKAPPKKKQKKAPNPDAPKRVRKPAAPKPKPPEPKAYAPKPAFAESIDHLAHKKPCAPCPLCGGQVQVMWFSTVMHLEVCVDDKCFFPFNLKGTDYWSKFGGLTTTATKNKFVPVYRKHAASLPPPPDPVSSGATIPARSIPRAQPPQRCPAAPPNTLHATAAAAAATVAAKASAHTSKLAKSVASPAGTGAAVGSARSAAALAAARKLAGATVTTTGKTRTVMAASRNASPAPAAASGRPKVVAALPVQIPSSVATQLPAPVPSAPTAAQSQHMPMNLNLASHPPSLPPGDPFEFLFGQVGAPAAAAVVGQGQLPTPVVSPNSTPSVESGSNSHDAFMAMLLGGSGGAEAGGIGSAQVASVGGDGASGIGSSSDLDALLGSGPVNIDDLESILNSMS